jgi:hypothetical protein
MSVKTSSRPTVCVSCGGWEGGFAVETEETKARQMLKKRGAYPPSAARFVGQINVVEGHLVQTILLTFALDTLLVYHF